MQVFCKRHRFLQRSCENLRLNIKIAEEAPQFKNPSATSPNCPAQGLTEGCRRLYLRLDLLCSPCVCPITFTYIGDTLQKKETECRRCELSLAATPVQSSMQTSFADLEYVHSLWSSLFKHITLSYSNWCDSPFKYYIAQVWIFLNQPTPSFL